MIRASTLIQISCLGLLGACADLIGADFGSARLSRSNDSGGSTGTAPAGGSGESHVGGHDSGAAGQGGGSAPGAGGIGGGAGTAAGTGEAGQSGGDDETAGTTGTGRAAAGGAGSDAGARGYGDGGASGATASQNGGSRDGSEGGSATSIGDGGRGDLLAGGHGGLPTAGGGESNGGAGGEAAASPAAGGTSSGGAAGSGGEGACGAPTIELDPDGDGLNDECDLDDDEDSWRDGADPARRDPLWPRPVDDLSWPGVVLADECVRRAVEAAGAALASAGLALEFPLHLGHEPAQLGPYFVRPGEGVEQGHFVGGPDATPGMQMPGAELKVLRGAPERAGFAFHEFDATGVLSKMRIRELHLRGSSRAITMVYGLAPVVRIVSGSVAAGVSLRDVASLMVNVGAHAYPTRQCPGGAGRWALSWAPIWRQTPVEELRHLCVDEGAAYAAGETWTRSSGAEHCTCKSAQATVFTDCFPAISQ